MLGYMIEERKVDANEDACLVDCHDDSSGANVWSDVSVCIISAVWIGGSGGKSGSGTRSVFSQLVDRRLLGRQARTESRADDCSNRISVRNRRLLPDSKGLARAGWVS